MLLPTSAPSWHAGFKMVCGMAEEPMLTIFKFPVHFRYFNGDCVLATSQMLQYPIYYRNHLKTLF